jgi:CheY-like chemotaxis protein
MTHGSNSSNGKLRVMLVDDSHADVRLLSIWLERSPLVGPLQAVHDGDQACALLECPEGSLPDLVLLDVNLPRRSGFEVLAAIRADRRLDHLPVIMLTGSSAPEDIQRARALGADLCVIKPADAEEFGRFVETVESFHALSFPRSESTPKGG